MRSSVDTHKHEWEHLLNSSPCLHMSLHILRILNVIHWASSGLKALRWPSVWQGCTPLLPTCGALLIMITIFLYVEFNNLIVWHNLSQTTDGSTLLHQPSVYSFLAFFEHLFRFHLKSQRLQSSIRSDFARPNSFGWFFLTHLFRITISRFKFKLIL